MTTKQFDAETGLTKTFRHLPVRKSASRAFRKALSANDPVLLQQVLQKESAKPQRKLNSILGADTLATLWSATSLGNDDTDIRLIEVLTGTAESLQWEQRAEVLNNQPRSFSFLHTLAAAEVLIRRPDCFSANQFTDHYVHLAELKPDDFPKTNSDDVMILAVEGEVSFVLSLLLAPLQCAKLWRARATELLADFVESSTDTDGTVQAQHTRQMRQWLAPFVRVAAWSKAFKQPWGRKATLDRWCQAVEFSASLITRSGFLCELTYDETDETHGGSRTLALFTEAVDLTDLATESPVPAFLKSLRRDATKKRKAHRTAPLSVVSRQSDWAASAILRNELSADADAISLDWHSAEHRLAMAALGTPFVNGIWQSDIVVDGKPVDPIGNCVCTCWFQDDEVAFAELESGSSENVRHVRHVLLSLKDHFAVLADTVTAADKTARINFESRLTLPSSFRAESNPVTRDLWLDDSDVRVRAIPAWLNDDRVNSVSGDFHVAGRKLISRAEQCGGMTVPVVFEWHPDRRHREADWDRLTVTEERRVNSAHEASAYRVRVGQLNLLIYRSLRHGEALRAILGFHTASESVYGQVETSGSIAPLVMVESEV